MYVLHKTSKTLDNASQVEETFSEQTADEKQQTLRNIWNAVKVEIVLKNNNKVRTFFPLMRMRTIMKLDEKGPISTEATTAMSFLCELFIHELTCISWIESSKRQSKTICKLDTVKAAKTYEHMDFLVDVLPPYVPLFYGNHRRSKPKEKKMILKEAIDVIKVVEKHLQTPNTVPFNPNAGVETTLTNHDLQTSSSLHYLSAAFPHISFNQSIQNGSYM